MTNPELIARLISIDGALASRRGLHLGEMADQFGVSQKTIRRDVATLADIKPVTCQQVDADNHVGRRIGRRVTGRITGRWLGKLFE